MWYVQLFCPTAVDWVTVAVADERPQAAERASVYFREYICENTRRATAVRLRNEKELAREPGALEQAHETLAREITRLAAHA